MIEKKKQLVIFGAFDGIDFESISNLLELKTKYPFILIGKEEVQTFPISASRPIDIPPTVIRPVLMTPDKKFSVFFGRKRIHVEELDSDVLTYDDFISKAEDLIVSIMSSFKLSINRIAVNGIAMSTDQNYSNKIFNKFFKKNSFNDQMSDDWGFRVNYKFINKEQKPINRIITANQRKELIDNQPTDALYITYDYNTFPNQTFSDKEIGSFIKEAIGFRKKVLLDE